MNSTIVGILFILATVLGVIAAAMYSPILYAPDYLVRMAANQRQMIIIILLEFFMAMSCAGIGIALYPILKKYSQGLAIGALGFRVIESSIQVLIAVYMVSFLALSQEYVKAGVPTNSFFQAAGAILKAGSDWMSNGAMLLPWCIAALLYYFVFYKYNLIPRWISTWGLIGITLTIISSFLSMVNINFGSLQTAANLPIAVQEMVFAIWLIVKGLNPDAVVFQSA